MIYLLDKHERLLTIVPAEVLSECRYKMELNRFDEVHLEAVQDAFFDEWAAAQYVAFFHNEVFRVFRIVEHTVSDVRYVRGIDRAESDLRTVSVIKDKRPREVTADQALAVALEGTGYQVGNVENLPLLGSTSFYYISPLAALVKILERWQCEFRVRYHFVENRVTGRFIDLYKKQGRTTGKQFVYGDDLLSVVHEETADEVVTALIGRGKGEELDSGGYGRRIEFSDVVWSRAAGHPVDKPAGQNYVVNDEAKNRFGLSQDGVLKHRWGVFVDDQIEDPVKLLERTYEELKRLSVPLTVFKASILSIGQEVHLGDSVAIIRDDIRIAFEARIQKITVDMLAFEQSEVVLGDYQALRDGASRSAQGRMQEAMQEQLSEFAQGLQEQLLRIEAEKQARNAEIDERFRLTQLDFDNYKQKAEQAAQIQATSLLSEIEGKIAESRQEPYDLAQSAKRIAEEAKRDLASASERLQGELGQATVKTRTLEENIGQLRSTTEEQTRLLAEQARNQQDTTSRVTTVEETLEGTRTNVSELTRTVNQATGDLAGISRRTKTVEDDLGQTRRQYEALSQTVNTQTGQMDSISRRTGTIEAGLAGVQEKVENLQTTDRELRSEIANYKRTAEESSAALSRQIQTVEGKTTEVKTFAQQTAERLTTRLESLESFKNGEGARASQYFSASRDETARQLSALRTAITDGYVAKATHEEDVRGIQRRFESLQVGATNLFRLSESTKGVYKGTTNQDIRNARYATGPRIAVQEGEQYLLQVWSKAVNASSWIGVNQLKADGSHVSGSYRSYYPSRDRRYYRTELSAMPEAAYFQFSFSDEVFEENPQLRIKLERGTIPTDWSPAPEDNSQQMEQKIAHYAQTVDRNLASLTQQVGDRVTSSVMDQKLREIRQSVTSLEGQALKHSEVTITENGVTLGANKTIGANTLSSILATSPESIQAITNKMVITPQQLNLVRPSQRQTAVSQARDLWLSDLYEGEIGAGDEFLFQADVTKTAVGGNHDLNMFVQVVAGGANRYYFPVFQSKTAPLNQTQKITANVKIPAGQARGQSFRVGFNQNAWSNFSSWKLDNIQIYKKSTAELIVDGSITGRHLMTNTIEAGHIRAGTITGNLLAADAIEARHLKVDNAFFDKLTAGDALVNKLTAKSVFATAVRTVTIDASKITSGILRATNGAMTINLNTAGVHFYQNAKIEFASKDNAIFRKRDTHTAFVHFEDANDSNQSVYAAIGVTSSGDGINSKSSGRFAGARFFRSARGTSHESSQDYAEIYGDTVYIKDDFRINRGFCFRPSVMQGMLDMNNLYQAVIECARGLRDLKNGRHQRINQLIGGV